MGKSSVTLTSQLIVLDLAVANAEILTKVMQSQEYQSAGSFTM